MLLLYLNNSDFADFAWGSNTCHHLEAHLIKERPAFLVLSSEVDCIYSLVDRSLRPQEGRLAGAQNAGRGGVQQAPLGIDEWAGKGIFVGIQALQLCSQLLHLRTAVTPLSSSQQSSQICMLMMSSFCVFLQDGAHLLLLSL